MLFSASFCLPVIVCLMMSHVIVRNTHLPFLTTLWPSGYKLQWDTNKFIFTPLLKHFNWIWNVTSSKLALTCNDCTSHLHSTAKSLFSSRPGFSVQCQSQPPQRIHKNQRGPPVRVLQNRLLSVAYFSFVCIHWWGLFIQGNTWGQTEVIGGILKTQHFDTKRYT